VETVKRQLEPALAGRTIRGVKVLDPLLVAPLSPAAFRKRLRGQVVTSIDRRGKYLRLHLKTGMTLVIHLRMTGKLTYEEAPLKPAERRHLRLVLMLDNGGAVYFHDQRRFGKAFLLTPEESAAYWHKLGPEPLARQFNRKVMMNILRNRRRPVKSLLLDQSLIAGIGNIYADEALFDSGIHPLRPSEAISEEEAARLVRSIKSTLRRAIRLQGSSIDTYRNVRGERGRFQETFRVHRRQGHSCLACGGGVAKIKVGGRGTYFCPSCQK
jgi:formamidopyrimidine-DNA glycosylase